MTFAHLGDYSDWVAEAARQLRPAPRPPTRALIRAAIGFGDDTGIPADVRVASRWERDGVHGEEVSWSVGFGPRTSAWVLRPAAAAGRRLPGVVALHCHSGLRRYGKEKVADGPGEVPAAVSRLRDEVYSGRAYANVLARRGFVVLVHDVFTWGSRRFAVESMPSRLRAAATAGYDAVCADHEALVAKYCAVLGTSLAGVVAREDRAALAYLRSRPDVDPGRVGAVGLSGGGARAALLQATADHLDAAVVVGMMSTMRGLLDRHVDEHTWMFFPPGLAALCDWPVLAASRAPSPLLVQYNRRDPLFDPRGMDDADALIRTCYGSSDGYTGEFYDGRHVFDAAMQESAFDWLASVLSPPPAVRG